MRIGIKMQEAERGCRGAHTKCPSMSFIFLQTFWYKLRIWNQNLVGNSIMFHAGPVECRWSAVLLNSVKLWAEDVWADGRVGVAGVNGCSFIWEFLLQVELKLEMVDMSFVNDLIIVIVHTSLAWLQHSVKLFLRDCDTVHQLGSLMPPDFSLPLPSYNTYANERLANQEYANVKKWLFVSCEV